MKKCLTSDPILKPIDLNRDIIISCDACQTGIGFAVMQSDNEGMLHVVRYGSFATTQAQSNYNSEDLEAVRLMYALKSIEWLAQCRRVTVITDHTAVLHIADWSPRNRRQRRMLTYIMQFPLTVLYIRGCHNALPDALSRMFQESTAPDRRSNEPRFMHEIDDFILPVTTRSANRASLTRLQKPSINDTDSNAPSDQRMDGQIVNNVAPDASEEAIASGIGNSDNSDPHVDLDGTLDQPNLDKVVNDNETPADGKNKLPATFPVISSEDYQRDDEFRDMCKYLQFGELSDNARRDKTTMIMSDRYMIDLDGLLYKMDLPCQKNLARLKPIMKRLCVPLRFRHDMIAFVHEHCGHYA